MRVSSALCALALCIAKGTAQSLPEAISSIPELSNLSFYVGQSQPLRDTFGLPRNVTILAPENRAFIDLVRAVNADPTMPLPNTGGIRGFLQYHVVNGTHEAGEFNSTPKFLSTRLTNPGFTNVTSGQVVQFIERDGDVNCISGLNAQAQIVRPDIRFDEGVLHVINQVLTLPQSTTATLLAANMTAFLGALNVGGNVPAFNDMRNVTVFAATNHGFERVGSVIENIPVEGLSRVTSYHMIPGQILYSTDLQNTTISTLAGENLTVSVIDGVAFINSARVESTDVLINNGVMHIISDVLNPDNRTVRPDPNSDVQPVAFGGATSEPVPRLTGGQPTPTSVIPLFPAGFISGGPTIVPPPPPTTTSETTTTTPETTTSPMTTTSPPTTTEATTTTSPTTTSPTTTSPTTTPSPTTSPSPPTGTGTPSPTGPPAGSAWTNAPHPGVVMAVGLGAVLICA